jgi:CRP/FNR family transcriptional regulator
LRLPSGRSLDVEFRARPEPARQRVHLSFRSFADRDSDNDWLAMDKSSLNSVPRATRRDLFRGGLRQKLAAGERLIGPLTGAPWAVLVTAGIVRLFVAMDGFEPTIVYGASGSMFGTYALIAPDPLLVGLQSVTPSVILNLSARRVEELVASSSKFAGAVSSDVRLQLQELVRAFAGRSATNLKQRLAREIMLLSDLQPEDRLVSVTEQQLADGVGSIRESIGRTIGDLRREGSIATTRHGLIVLDAVTLRLAGEVEIV